MWKLCLRSKIVKGTGTVKFFKYKLILVQDIRIKSLGGVFEFEVNLLEAHQR